MDAKDKLYKCRQGARVWYRLRERLSLPRAATLVTARILPPRTRPSMVAGRGRRPPANTSQALVLQETQVSQGPVHTVPTRCPLRPQVLRSRCVVPACAPLRTVVTRLSGARCEPTARRDHNTEKPQRENAWLDPGRARAAADGPARRRRASQSRRWKSRQRA